MTPKQEERIRAKISKIKADLAADKKRWGGFYDDSRGLRYLPPSLYLQLSDYSGALHYFTWFRKNFPDDSGFPFFLFEWTVVLFKTGRKKEAEQMAFKTFCSNTYLFDKFFKRPIVPVEKWEGSNLETADYAMQAFDYSYNQDNLTDFAAWLDGFTKSEKFIRLSNRYIEIHQKLAHERTYEIRSSLVREARQLQNEIIA